MPSTDANGSTTASLLCRETRIALLSAGPPENDEAILALWDHDLDTPKLQFIAQWERATLILWRRLRKMLDRLPHREGTDDLQKAANVWEFKLLQLEARLMQLLDILAPAGIDTIPLKGAGLAYTVYNAFTDRPMNDLDLLIRKDQAMEAWRLAQQQKWSWDAKAFPLEKYEAHHHLPPLKDVSGSGVRVEIHTDMCLPGHPFHYSADDVWATSRRIEAMGREFTVPSPQHQLLYCCLHFAWMHAMQDKAWLSFLDINAFSQMDDFDWDAFVDLARKSNAETVAYWTLRLARSLSNIRTPDDVANALKPRLPGYVLTRLERQYALNMFPTDQHCPSVWLEDMLFRAGIQRGKHVVEMHEFVDPEGAPPPHAYKPNLLTRVGGHLKTWRKWADYLRMAVFGSKA